MNLGELGEADAARRRTFAATAAEHWAVFQIDAETVARARQAFPLEPIRTLYAIHLSTALVARSVVTDLQVLSLDECICGNAAELGFDVVPAA